MDELREEITAVVTDGLARADLLKPGAGFLNLTAGATDSMAFARAEAGAHLTDAMTAFGFAQVQDSWTNPTSPEFVAGVGLGVIW